MKKILEFIKNVKDWVATDGLLHIETSALLLIIFQLFMPIYISALLTISIGLIKETIDYWVKKCNNKEQVTHDIICDLVGILIGVIYVILSILLNTYAR